VKAKTTQNEGTAFGEGMAQTIRERTQEIQALYLADQTPWVVGYSGGKDSTAVLQLVWMAIADLPEDVRKKPVYVISTDTLVENPVVAAWVESSLELMRSASNEAKLPFEPHRLTPSVDNSFWVNLIGKGYPAPRHKFRWCTERLKISPSNRFILDVVQKSGEAILALGTRKAESSIRRTRMTSMEKHQLHKRLVPNASLPNALVYTPIDDWSNDDVWLFLVQYKNPWGYRNKDLLTMYQGASPDGECPLVVDTTTPSCGDSRFGCWVCTLVDKDKSMAAMIQNDREKEWMLPLLRFRDLIDFRKGGKLEGDRHLRDYRRMSGSIQIFHDRLVHGPYTQETRQNLLRELLKAQTWIQKNGPKEVRALTLISQEELDEIRRIWVVDKHEIEDALPHLYEEETGQPFPGAALEESLPFGADEMALLRDVCGDNRQEYEMVRELVDSARRYRSMVRRAGVFTDLEGVLTRFEFDGEEEALAFARRHRDARARATAGLQFGYPSKSETPDRSEVSEEGVTE
jgi:DNA sulfur modification protein DndC